MTTRLFDGLRPLATVGPWATAGFAAATAVAVVAAWQAGPAALPGPTDIAHALARLWTERGLFDQLAASVAMNARAIAWSTALGLALAYLTVLPALRPAVHALTKLRFTGLVGWGFVLATVARDGHQLKLWMLVFAMTPFYLTAMAAVIAAIPRERIDHARTLGLGLGGWRVVGEVVVRGTAADALEAMRQNAAMGWMMLTAVEGVVRSEGGLGTMLLDESKHLDLAAVFAVITVVLAVGALQDRLLVALRRAACPYAELTRAS